MKERGILFSAAMVRALLAGTKSQTRRTVKDIPLHGHVQALSDGTWEWSLDGGFDHAVGSFRCPYGAPGDRLWVRETWQQFGGDDVVYRATDDCDPLEGWRPSIFMPRAASRITLEITDVRVQRLNDISEDDARAEGVVPFPNDPEGDCWTDGTHRSAYEYLWGEINGWDGDPKARATWKSNPFVWVLSFRRVTP